MSRVVKKYSPRTPHMGGRVLRPKKQGLLPDTFKLLVFYEHHSWDERILQNLEDEEIGLEPLEVYIARMAHLAGLSDAAFGALGENEVIEDGN